MDHENGMPNGAQDVVLYRLDQQDRKSDQYRDEVRSSLGRLFEQLVETNKRVGNLEKWRYMVTGALIVVSMTIGWVVTLKSGH